MGQIVPEIQPKPSAPMPILSLGYGSQRTCEDLIELLNRYRARYLVDVGICIATG